MDWSHQPAVPAQPPFPTSPFAPQASYSPPASFSPAPATSASETGGRPLLGDARRTVATALLAVGLLTVGGAAVVFAADPSASPAPNATTQPSTGGGTTRPNGQAPAGHNGVNCPNMGGSRGSGGSGAAPGSSAAPSTNGSTSSPQT